MVCVCGHFCKVWMVTFWFPTSLINNKKTFDYCLKRWHKKRLLLVSSVNVKRCSRNFYNLDRQRLIIYCFLLYWWHITQILYVIGYIIKILLWRRQLHSLCWFCLFIIIMLIIHHTLINWLKLYWSKIINMQKSRVK